MSQAFDFIGRFDGPSDETILRDFRQRTETHEVVCALWLVDSDPWGIMREVQRLELDVTLAGEIWRKLEAEVSRE